jgi:UDP-N-acetylmuramoyl-tripeptide--D-alanyl-D-alanine ligase
VIRLRLGEIAEGIGGTLAGGADPDAVVTGSVEFDSREVGPGGLFVALPGESADGHDFAAAAVESGALAVLAAKDVGVPAIVVDDTLAALGRLARLSVDRLPDTTVVSITGSSGKTSTKDMIAGLAARLGPTVAPVGTLNNEQGHPYTALKADERTRYLVLECSARHVGDIRYLCEIAPPRIGVVLNVGAAHLGKFGSVEAIAQAKGEMVEALPADGLAVLNADDERVSAMAARTAARVVTFGTAAGATVRASDITLDEAGRPAYVLHTPAGSAPVRLALYGEHQVGNTLAATAVALELGMSMEELPAALGELRPVSERRMDVLTRSDGSILIDDSYNANLASMTAALRALVKINISGYRWAVLGYMAELGDAERAQHEQVGRLAVDLGVDRIVAVGELAGGIHDGARARATQTGWEGQSVQVPDQQAAIELLRCELRGGDAVLVKGSRYRTWDVADALREEV